jgi:hypothetical protein
LGRLRAIEQAVVFAQIQERLRLGLLTRIVGKDGVNVLGAHVIPDFLRRHGVVVGHDLGGVERPLADGAGLRMVLLVVEKQGERSGRGPGFAEGEIAAFFVNPNCPNKS